jgi:hypothetical protein
VHETEEHGHDHLLIHRHLAAHTFNHHQDGHDTVLDEDERPVLTIEPVYTVPVSTTVVSPPLPTVFEFRAPTTVRLVSRSRDEVEHLIHGPPRAPTGLRAPPLSSRL